MLVKKELNDFDDLKKMCWSGAVYTLETIEENNKEEELMDFIEEVFYNNTPTETELNDFLWFDSDYIYETLGIEEE